jgi:hypothetical protein
MFTTLTPPQPGVWRNGTKAEAAGRWFEANLVRWRNGRLRPVGGWQLFETTPTTTPARGGIAWRDNAQFRWLALGTADALYCHDNGTLTNITPTGFTPGRTTGVFGTGFGAGPYGDAAWGTARVTGDIVLDAATWSLDTFGETLVGVSTGDGKLYEWTPSQLGAVLPADRLAKEVTNAPDFNTGCFVTGERHLVAIGADGDPRLIRWSSREDRTLWAPSATNTAGDFTLTTAGRLMRGMRYKGESILFTDADVHRMTFVGSPLVYGFEQISRGVDGLLGPNAVCETADRLVWMGASNFWTYDGVVRMLPCDVHDYVFGDINLLQGPKACAGHNVEFSEVWFFYCSGASLENDRYVIWNYKDNWWSYGQLARSTWIPREVWPYAVAASPDGYLYQHEQGWTDNGTTRVGQVYASTGALTLGEGDRFMDVGMLMPDADTNDPGSEQNVSVEFALKENLIKAAYRTAGPYTFGNASGYCQARFSARMVEMRVEATADDIFTFGKLRADIKPGGGR